MGIVNNIQKKNMAKSVTFISTLTPEWYFMSKPLTSIGARENIDWETTKTVMNYPAAIASIGRERGTIMSLLNLTDTKKWPN